MYRLLIVDDEPWVLRSLADSVGWENCGFTLAGTATDGKEALEAMESILPDLVVTDIRMPVMDGLAMIGEARGRWPNMQFIILSGHAEFEYARKALASGVAGYCLKPVQSDEMEEVLLKVRLELDGNAARRMEWLLSIDESDDAGQVMEACRRAGVPWDVRDGMRVVCGPCGWGTQMDGNGGLSLVPESMLPALLNLPASENAEGVHGKTVMTRDAAAPKISMTDQSIGISRNIGHPQLVGKAVTDAQSARRQWFLTGKPGKYVFTSGPRGPIRKLFERLAAAVDIRSAAGIREVMKELEMTLATGEYGLRQVLYCWNRLLDLLYFQDGFEPDQDPETENDILEMFPSLPVMLNTFSELLVKSISTGDAPGDHPGSEAVRDILAYTGLHATERISLMDIAERFHYNPSYLCRVFKRETGMTLTDHLMRLRLDKAAELLGATVLSIASIAEQCGYQDYFYFSRLFKRTFGMTPSQYRACGKVMQA